MIAKLELVKLIKVMGNQKSHGPIKGGNRPVTRGVGTKCLTLHRVTLRQLAWAIVKIVSVRAKELTMNQGKEWSLWDQSS